MNGQTQTLLQFGRCLAIVVVLALSTGCSMCASPYDYCGPTFTGGCCDTCGGCGEPCGGCGDPCWVIERLGSNLSGLPYVPGTTRTGTPYGAYDPLNVPDQVPIAEPEMAPQPQEPLPAPPTPLESPTAAGGLNLRR